MSERTREDVLEITRIWQALGITDNSPDYLPIWEHVANLKARADAAEARVKEVEAQLAALFEASEPYTTPKPRGVVLTAPPNFPRIVCLCGSGRFKDAFDEAEFNETLSGKIVLTIGCNTKDVARTPDLEHHKPMLDELHKRKIDLCDEVLVLNVGGYIGSSTRSEIEYAIRLCKTVRYLEDTAIDTAKAGETR